MSASSPEALCVAADPSEAACDVDALAASDSPAGNIRLTIRTSERLIGSSFDTPVQKRLPHMRLLSPNKDYCRDGIRQN
jgi:hypothetical protein